MEIKYIFSNPEDLLEEDSSLSLGWFVMDNINVFEHTKCMVIIAIADLAEGLKHLRKYKSGGFAWNPADNGETVLFQRSGNKISFRYKTQKKEIEFDLFYKSVYDSGNALATELFLFRHEVTTETAYIDLINTLKN